MGKFIEWFNKNPHFILEAGMTKCPQCGSPSMGGECMVCGAKIPQVDKLTAAIDANRASRSYSATPAAARPAEAEPFPDIRSGVKPTGKIDNGRLNALLYNLDKSRMYTHEELVQHFGSEEAFRQAQQVWGFRPYGKHYGIIGPINTRSRQQAIQDQMRGKQP